MLLKTTWRDSGEKLYLRKYYLIISALIFIICNYSFEVFAQGTIVNSTFYSKTLKKTRGYQIFLPQGYNQLESTVRYPVIYFLHGAGVNHNYYTGLFSVFNNLVAAHLISPLIVVKPDGSAPPWGGSYYTNSELYGNFEDYIVYDLVDFIDSAYNTIPSREKRAIMGHSTGAFGAMKLALKHPDIYCSVVANSGPLDFKNFSSWAQLVFSENGGSKFTSVPIYDPYAGGGSTYWTYLFYSMAGAFSPNLNNSPYPVDFPLDSLGNWIDSVWNRWSLHDPVLLARNITPDSHLTIFFDCGIYDEFKLYNFNTAFADSLGKLGLSYVFQSFNSDHMTQMYTRFSIGFQFLDSVMNVVVPVELTSFTATANGKEVTLSWSTATELNNQGFEVQRKFGSNDFVTIGSVRGHGTTTSSNKYTYVDKLIDDGKYFYRLKQIDFNGTFEYSNEIEVEVRVLDKFTLEQNYPNPFNPTTTIGYVLQERSNVKLTLLNSLGEEIAILVNEEQDKGYHKIEFSAQGGSASGGDALNLSSGVYFYRLVANNFVSTRKMLLLK